MDFQFSPCDSYQPAKPSNNSKDVKRSKMEFVITFSFLHVESHWIFFLNWNWSMEFDYFFTLKTAVEPTEKSNFKVLCFQEKKYSWKIILFLKVAIYYCIFCTTIGLNGKIFLKMFFRILKIESLSCWTTKGTRKRTIFTFYNYLSHSTYLLMGRSNSLFITAD